MGLRQNYLNVIFADLPRSDSVLKEGDPTYDERLGGRRGKDNWGQYARNYGTTCVITTNGWLRAAGAPADLVLTEDTPQGGGTKILQHLLAGAKTRGWLRTPVKGQLPDLRPGDIIHLNHVVLDKDGNATNPPQDGTHVGTVVRVVSNDGQALVVETADGGQGARNAQTMTRQLRTFTLGTDGHAVHFKGQYTSGWLEQWIRVGGDEGLDDGAGGASGAGPGTASSSTGSGAGIVLGLAGLALVAGGAWLAWQKGGWKVGAGAGVNALSVRDQIQQLIQGRRARDEEEAIYKLVRKARWRAAIDEMLADGAAGTEESALDILRAIDDRSVLGRHQRSAHLRPIHLLDATVEQVIERFNVTRDDSSPWANERLARRIFTAMDRAEQALRREANDSTSFNVLKTDPSTSVSEMRAAMDAVNDAYAKLAEAEKTLAPVSAAFKAIDPSTSKKTYWEEADRQLPGLRAAQARVREAQAEVKAANQRLAGWNDVVRLQRGAPKTVVGREADDLLRELAGIGGGAKMNALVPNIPYWERQRDANKRRLPHTTAVENSAAKRDLVAYLERILAQTGWSYLPAGHFEHEEDRDGAHYEVHIRQVPELGMHVDLISVRYPDGRYFQAGVDARNISYVSGWRY